LQRHAYLSEAEIYNDYGLPKGIKEIKQEFSQEVFLKATEEDGNRIGSVRASSIVSYSCITCLMYCSVSSFSDNASTPLLFSTILLIFLYITILHFLPLRMICTVGISQFFCLLVEPFFVFCFSTCGFFL
jgi:hypothetical protein